MHHNNNFDFLRLLAAIMVWYSHCYGLAGLSPDPLERYIPFETFGSLGVTAFFVISGFFIPLSYENHNNLLRFTRNRLLRIWPALCAVTLVSIFLLGPALTTLKLPAYFADSVTWRYFRNLLVFPLQYHLPGVFGHNPNEAVNGSLWTLQHEVRLYAVIGILGVLGILQPRLMFALLVGLYAIRCYGMLWPPGDKERVLTFQWGKLELMVRLASQFAAGSFIYLARSRLKLHLGFFLLATLLAAASCWTATHVGGHIAMTAGNMAFDLAFAYMVIYLGFARLPLFSLASKWGDVSYGFYLYAFPVQQASLQWLGGSSADFHVFMAVSFVATLLCAILSCKLVEEPAIRWKM